ncbi:hypothetical protein DID88_006644 [Monilinia fructigena]|uniref:Uncharacterized protein n=1 Tax=Monilinia fructigena TaxID=38457 RepID=A0A395ILD0_9HELO|nr:hypothetical protein DID88_006644 [Monilinia fructigena]
MILLNNNQVSIAIMSTEKPLPFAYQFAAGAIAGVSEVPIGCREDQSVSSNLPYFNTPTHQCIEQNVDRRIDNCRPARGPDGYNGMVDCFRKIIKNERCLSIIPRNRSPNLDGSPQTCHKFAANESWGKFYRDIFGVAKMNQSLSILTGATAGATESFVVVPFRTCQRFVCKIAPPLGHWLFTTDWKVQCGDTSYGTPDTLDVFPSQGINAHTENKKQEMLVNMVSGAIEEPRVAGLAPKYNWAWPALGTVMKEEGFAALYKGFLPKVLRLGPGGGILLVVFTGVTDFFRKMRADKGL